MALKRHLSTVAELTETLARFTEVSSKLHSGETSGSVHWLVMSELFTHDEY